jgi:hypothetical protein
MARSSARAKVAPAQRHGRAVANGLVARRPPTAAKRPSPGCTGDARRLTRRPCSRPNDERATARSVAVQAGVGSAPAGPTAHPVAAEQADARTGCGQTFAAESRAHGRRAGRLTAARRAVVGPRVSSTPTNPPSRAADRSQAQKRHRTATGTERRFTNAAEESSADAHTSRRCALSPSRGRSSAAGRVVRRDTSARPTQSRAAEALGSRGWRHGVCLTRTRDRSAAMSRCSGATPRRMLVQ